jgi:hypothetical protein
VPNFLLVRLQLGDIAPHLLLSGRELACEQVNILAYYTQLRPVIVPWSTLYRARLGA